MKKPTKKEVDDFVVCELPEVSSRKKTGRPVEYKDGYKIYSISLTEREHEALKEIDESLTKAIKKLIAQDQE